MSCAPSLMAMRTSSRLQATSCNSVLIVFVARVVVRFAGTYPISVGFSSRPRWPLRFLASGPCFLDGLALKLAIEVSLADADPDLDAASSCSPLGSSKPSTPPRTAASRSIVQCAMAETVVGSGELHVLSVAILLLGAPRYGRPWSRSVAAARTERLCSR